MSSTSPCTQIDLLPTSSRLGAASSTVVGTPWRASSSAAVIPTGPAPTTTTLTGQSQPAWFDVDSREMPEFVSG
jgi:hypothetical protein